MTTSPDPDLPSDGNDGGDGVDVDRLLELLGDVSFQFWSCPRNHPREPLRTTVVWDGDVATCTDCGMTNRTDPRAAGASDGPADADPDNADTEPALRAELDRLRDALTYIAGLDYTGTEPEACRYARQTLAGDSLALPEYRRPIEPPSTTTQPAAVVHLDARVLWSVGYWDGILSGVCLLDGRLCWFETPDDPIGDERRYFVYDLTDAEARSLVTSHLMFETFVGGHTCHHTDHTGVRPRSEHATFYDWAATQPDIDHSAGKEPLGTIDPATPGCAAPEDQPT